MPKPAEATPSLRQRADQGHSEPTKVISEPAKEGEPAKPEEVAAPKPPKPDPVSVFISRKTGKLYVRHGWDPLFEVPVTIRNPELVWGTHVFTALEFKEDKSTLRWVAVTLPPDSPRRMETRTDRTTGKKVTKPVPAPPAVQPMHARSRARRRFLTSSTSRKRPSTAFPS